MADALDTIQTLLSTNWIAANTDSQTPHFGKIMEERSWDLATGDAVWVYMPTDEQHTPYAIGGKSWREEPLVSIDIRTTYGRAGIADIRPHLIKLKEEVLRIVRAAVANPDANYTLLVTRRASDRSDKTIGLGRWVIDVHLDGFRTS